MKLAETPSRLGHHGNAFGFLRLLFASLVIVSHVPEIVDQSARRELLYQLTGEMTFGRFAVWGFFVISGYLITGSLLNSSSKSSYIAKRVARIYPAFIAASLICLIVVVPLSGGTWAQGLPGALAEGAARMAILTRPMAEGVFPGQHFNDYATALNGAMWTIQYEFLCYLIAIALMVIGAFRTRSAVPVLSLSLIVVGAFGAGLLPDWLSRRSLFPGGPEQLFLLPGIFLAGASFYLFRESLDFKRHLIAGACVGLFASMFSAYTAPIGYAVFGTYLIFAAAKSGAGTWVGKINDKTDISYGVYLYAWPAEQLLIRYVGTSSLLLLMVLTWAIAAAAGWLSWIWVERPVATLMRNLNSRKATSLAIAKTTN